MIIAFEGVDGAGKNTLVTAVEAELLARELPVARAAFPRYEESVHAQLAQRALRGSMGDLIDSVHGMATLFALDRAEIAEQLSEFDADGYIILLDRYIASNAAYSVARMQLAAAQADDVQATTAVAATHPVTQWVEQLEVDTCATPTPHLQVLVDVPATVAEQRAASREATDHSRTRDAYETNTALQQHTVAAYRGLAQNQWLSPWHIADCADGATTELAQNLAEIIERSQNMER